MKPRGHGDGAGPLSERIASGDPAAVERLLGEHLPAIEGFVRRHAGGLLREREAPSDLAQSVCREVLERLRDGRLRFEGEAQLGAWLRRAAVLKMMTRDRFWRAERREAGRVDAPASGQSEARFVDPLTPSREAAVHEELDRLAAALARLPATWREVVVLHHVEGLSHREIAARLGKSETHSRVLLSRALARLATLAGEPPPG